jgi:hypothetical protein
VRKTVLALVISLILLPLLLIAYRVTSLGYPLFPAAPQKVWQLSLDAHIIGDGLPGTLDLGLPSARQGITVFEEKISDGALDFTLRTDGTNRFGTWSGVPGSEGTVISYRATLMIPVVRSALLPSVSAFPPGMSRDDQHAADRIAADIRQLPPAERIRALAARVSGIDQDQDNALLNLSRKLGKEAAFLALLHAAGLPATTVEGLSLSEGSSAETHRWIEVWTGSEWQHVTPATGELYRKSVLFLPLTRGGLPVVNPQEFEMSDVRWTISRQVITQWGLQYERIGKSERLLDEWSLFRLPPEFQGTFRILILVPLGALMICILRNMIGFPTFGIFMPVLMALAFRSTGLLYGLGIFVIVLLVGYGARSSLERLRLLLVPRLSVMVTLVILCFTVFALIGNKVDLRAFMAIGLLPFVILTMAIERFFVIAEEEGLREALRTAAGSAAVASLTYAIIQFEPLQLTFFVYPELLLVVMAFQLMIGRYTGYRLSEFLRFRSLRRNNV